MSEHVATIEAVHQAAEPTEDTAGPPPERASADTAQQPAVALQDLLVEEVSIDGMCGVY
jgi:mycofactocin precursor